jgi:tetratricopeptide (TPR) repeat protein
MSSAMQQGPSDAERAEYHKTKGNSLFSLGMHLEACCEYDLSIEYSERNQKNAPFSARVLYNKGLVFMKLQKYDEAIEALNRSKTIYAECDPGSTMIAMCYKQIARSLTHLQRLSEALQSELYVLVIEESNKASPTDIAASLRRIGCLCHDLNLFESALIYYHKSLFLEESSNSNFLGIAITNANIGFSLHELGRNTEAMP